MASRKTRDPRTDPEHTPTAEDKLAGSEEEIPARDSTLPTIRVRPLGHALRTLGQGIDDALDDLYAPERVAQEFYKPAHEFDYLRFASTTYDPPRPHRLILPVQEQIKGGGWQLQHKEVFARTGADLRALSETPEYRKARFAEATGDWPRRISNRDYQRYVERDPVDAIREAYRRQALALRESLEQRLSEGSLTKLREAVPDTFGTDNTYMGTNPMVDIDKQYYVPILGGPYHRQLYLYAHWEQTAKAFEMKNHSELAKAAINIVSDFTLGRGVAWKIENPRVAEVWQEFWQRERMEQRIRTISDDLTWQGELLLRFYTRPKGFVCMRSLDPGSFYEIVTDPVDIETIYFYAAQYPCLHGDTRIALLDGTEPTIAELAERGEPQWVYSYDAATQRIVPGHASKIWKAGVKRCVEVELDSGEKVIASYDHPFLLRDGTYVWAEKLEPGDSLMPLYRSGRTKARWANPEQAQKMRDGLVVAHARRREKKNYPKGQWTRPDQAERMRRHAAALAARAESKKYRNHKVVAVRPAGDHVVYDIQVEDYHNFGLAAGVFTHNTQYQMVSWDFKGQKLRVPSQEYVVQQYAPSEMYHLKNNVCASEKWGRSDFYTAFSTLKRHRDWVNAATLKDLLQANLVWKIKVTGDQGDIDAFVADSANATLPPMGGTWIENDALTLEPMHTDVAGSAKMQGSTGQFLTALFATSQNMPVSYFNVAPGGTARATALTQGEPFIKKIGTRQQQFRMLLDHIFERVMREAVEAGRLDRECVRGEDADPEWVFPSAFEEDRGAKFRDLKTARENAAISHRTMSISFAQELGIDEYDYEEEQAAISEEQLQPVLQDWPVNTEQEVQLSKGGIPPPPGMPGGDGGGGNPFGADQQVANDPVKGGSEPPEMGGARTEKIKGADERASFRKEWTGHTEANRLTEAERTFLERVAASLKPGEPVLLPSGRVAIAREVGGAFDEENVTRGVTGPGTNAGSFAPKEGGAAPSGDKEKPASAREPEKTERAPRERMEKARPPTPYGDDQQKYMELKGQWARVNESLREDPDHPITPEAERAALKQLNGLVKEMYRLEADPGTFTEGIGMPGGPRDVVIIGAGPGGLSAAINGGTEGLDTLLLDAAPQPGGQARLSSRVENYPGFEAGIKGQELIDVMYRQAQRVGADTKMGVRVTAITHDPETGMKTLTLSNGETIQARAILLAMGKEGRRIEFPGSDSPQVVFGDYDELAARTGDKTAVIIGGGNSASQSALQVAMHAEKVYVLARDITQMSASQVDALKNHPRIEIINGDELASYDEKRGVVTTVKGQEIPAHAVGFFIGYESRTDWLPKELERNEDGQVLVDADMETKVPGIFAIGDVRKEEGSKYRSKFRIVAAAGQGAVAIGNTFEYFETEKAKRTGEIDRRKDRAGRLHRR